MLKLIWNRIRNKKCEVFFYAAFSYTANNWKLRNYSRDKILDTRNTDKKKSWTHEIPPNKILDPRKTHEKKIGTREIPTRKNWNPRIQKRKNFGSTKHPRRHDDTTPTWPTIARDPCNFTLELMWVISKIIFYVSTLSEMCVISHAFVINVYSKTFLDLYTKDIAGSEILNIHVFFLYKQRSFFNSVSVLLNNHHNHHCT